ncbi:MAG: TolC family outer membrane protein [Campylobacterales bacterium]|nr:TolC family outer membrane protein [Campylobacterales bacterium]
MKKFLLVSTLLVAHLGAQTLQESVAEVLSTNPSIQERLKNYESVKQDINIAKSDYYPKLDLNLGAGYEQTNRSYGSDEKFSVYQNSLTYTHNIFRGFNTYYKVEEQELRTISAAYSYIEKVNSISFEMTTAYIELLKNSELLATEQKNVEINEEILTKVKKLYDSGLTTLSEVNKIESSVALAKSNQVVQENSLLEASYNFQKVLGHEVNATKLSKPAFTYNFPASKEEALAFALQNNPSLQVGNFNVKQAQALKKANQANYYPSLDLEVSQNMNKNLSATEGTEDQFRAMAYLKYNLFNGFSDSSNIIKANTQMFQEVETKNALQRDVTNNLNLSWVSKEKLEQQLVHLYNYKDFSEKTLKLYANEYDLGRRSLLDLLSAQNDFIRSQQQIIVTEYNILLAKYRILNAMGILVPVIINDEKLIYNNVNL